MTFRVIIPARLHSSRLPRKVLLDIGGKPMVQRVYEQALASGAASVAIATDSQEVYDVAQQFGATVCLTSSHHPTGTDRLAEAISLLGYDMADIIVNVQGDEPFIPPVIVSQVADLLRIHQHAVVATLCEQISSLADVFNPNIVKVVMNSNSEALYFSRAPIPWSRDHFSHVTGTLLSQDLPADYLRHIGLYAYRAGFVQEFVGWPMATIEQVEQLEQLRILAKGFTIAIDKALAKSPIGVDTEADLQFARELVA
jgi:3-deoxy-manno-octulosonate cytidylyltransferase (CMP-KDO synthetase)